MNTSAQMRGIVRGFAWLGVVVASLWAVTWLWLGQLAIAGVVGVLSLLYVLTLLRLDRSPLRLMANVLIGATTVSLLVPIWATGGAGGKVVIWLAVVPVACALMLSTRDSLRWGALLVAGLAALWAVELAGGSPPSVVGPEHRALIDLTSDLTALVSILVLAQLATGARERSLARIEDSNRDLQRTAGSLRDQNRLLGAVLETSDRLRLELDLPQLLQEICRSICDALGWRYVLLSLRDYDAGSVRVVASAGYGAETSASLLARAPGPIERQDRFLTLGRRISSSVFIGHDDAHSREVHSAATVVVRMDTTGNGGDDAWHPDDVLMVPIVLRGQVLGLISPDEPRSGLRPTLEMVQALEVFANQAAVAIDNARLFQAERETAEILHARSAQLEQAYAELQAKQQHLLVSEKMAALGRVTAGIAHEINSPLGGVLNSLQLARQLTTEYRQSIDDPEVAREDHHQIADEMDDALSLAERATQKVSAFVRSIKDQTRIQEEAAAGEFDVAQEVGATLQLLAHLFRSRHIDVRVEAEAGLLARGDASRFTLVLQNLLSNAVDAYDTSGGEVRVSAVREGERVRVSVQDFGCGIPTEIRGRIFDYLFTTKDVGHGTGLGLSMVHDIVTSHFRGEVGVASEEGGGSTFWVLLALAARAEGTGAASAAVRKVHEAA
jgi:signal transduction histidine kinase